MSAPGKPQQTNAPGQLRAGTAAWIGAVAPIALGFGLAVFLAVLLGLCLLVLCGAVQACC